MTNLLSFSFSRQNTSALFNAQSKHKRTELILFGLVKTVVHCDFRGLAFAQLTLKISINITENTKVKRSLKYFPKNKKGKANKLVF